MSEQLPLWSVIRYEGGIDLPPADHVLTPWGWALLRSNAPGWQPREGFRVLHRGS